MVTTSDIIMETLEILVNARDTHAAERDGVECWDCSRDRQRQDIWLS